MNPYTGPRPFECGDQLFGRDKEREALRALLIAERVLVLHSPSGAGKTSLIQAALIPALQQSRFNVLPMIRLNAPLPTGVEANRYVFSMMLSLEEELPVARRHSDAALAQLDLGTYLAKRPRRKNAPRNTVLLFDQFEEVLTVAPLATKHKTTFFKQLGAALENEDYWALFVLREDYLAALEPYSALLPTHLANTFRLDLLQREAATQAIASPAAQGGKPFVATALNKLLDDLATQSIQQPDGSFQQAVGQYIEPVQLQVVCYRLWQQLSDNTDEINLSHLRHADNVNQALADYYANQVERIAANLHEQRSICEWFDEQLVSPQGIRTQVLKEKERSGGLANELIAGFVDAHLVRGEQRGGATWFELAHDRLIEPVRRSNAAWFDAHLHTMQRQAILWEKQGKSDSLLLRGKALRAAELWAKENAPVMRPIERELLQRSQKQRWQWQKVAMVFGVVIIATLVAVGTTRLWLVADTALNNAIRSQSYFLVEKAGHLVEEGKVFTAMRMALESLPGESETNPDKRPFLPEAQQQLYDAVDKHWRGTLEHDGTVNQAVFNPKGKQLLTYSGNQAYLWDITTRQLQVTLKGHEDIVRSASFSPDGTHVVTTSNDRTARLWDAHVLIPQQAQHPARFSTRSRQALFTLRGHKDEVVSASFSPDGTRIVTTSADKTARLWEAKSGQPLVTLQGHEDIVWSASFNPDGTRIVTVSEDHNAGLWDVRSGQLLALLIGHNNAVRSASFSVDGKHIVTASGGQTARLWDANSGQALFILQGHEGDVMSASFSPDGVYIVTTSADKTARLWEAKSGRQLIVLRGHEDIVWSASFSPNGLWLVTTSEDQTARLWDMRSEQALTVLTGHKNAVKSASFSFDSKRIVTASGGRIVRLWDVNSGQPLAILKQHANVVVRSALFSPDGKRIATVHDRIVQLWDVSSEQPFDIILQGHEAEVLSVSFSSDGKRIVTVSRDKTARVWEVSDGQLLTTLEGHEDFVRSALFSPDGEYIITASDDYMARVWNAHSGEMLIILQGHEDIVRSAAFSPDGKRIVTASDDHTARLWDARNGQPLALLKGHRDTVRSAVFSPDGKRIVTASSDRTARLWDARNGQPLALLKGHQDTVRSAVFSPDGKHIVTASHDHTARLWDAHGWPLAFLKGHKDTVRSALFSPDGKLVVTASGDHTARLWNANNGQPLATLQGHESYVVSASFNPDGTRIITASGDTTARLWQVFTSRKSLIEHAKQVLPYLRLTCEERDQYYLDSVARCAPLDKHTRGKVTRN